MELLPLGNRFNNEKRLRYLVCCFVFCEHLLCTVFQHLKLKINQPYQPFPNLQSKYTKGTLFLSLSPLNTEQLETSRYLTRYVVSSLFACKYVSSSVFCGLSCHCITSQILLHFHFEKHQSCFAFRFLINC